MNFLEQLSAITLLVDFLLGVALGMIGAASHGSRREDRARTLLGTAPDPVSSGARLIHGVHVSADDYMKGLLSGGGAAGADDRGIDDSGTKDRS